MTDAAVLQIESLNESTAILTLNRPDRFNALNIELMQSLCAAFDSLAAEPRRRLVLLCGAGKGFCSGLDLRETSDSKVAELSADWVARTFQTVRSSPLVTVCAAHGAAFAGGAGLLACCDFAVVASDLKIGFPEVRRGLIPALVAAVLQDRLREADLNELFLIAEPISAERALSMGLVHRVVPADQLFNEGKVLASLILKGGPEAVRHTKHWLHQLRSIDRSQALSAALNLHKQVRVGSEAQEGLDAFLQRREPNWESK